MRTFRTTLCFFALILTVRSAVRSQCVVDISTGIDEAGVPIAEGDEDDSYTVDLGFGPLSALVGGVSTGFPVPPWIANDDESLWISSTPNATDQPGSYTFEIIVEVPEDVDASRLAIVGRLSTDNSGTDILINDQSTGITAGGFDAYTNFPPAAGSGLFVPGENVIQFIVSNAGTDPNPVGLRVDACLEEVERVERQLDLSTGFSRAEDRLLADGESSDDWTIVFPDGSTSDATAVAADGFPIPPWIVNDIQSRWIGPEAEDASGPAGEYVFRTTVVLPAAGFDSERAALSGVFAADDQVSDVLINGESAGISGNGFDRLKPFLPTAAQGLFQAGENTVEFIVQNGTEGPVGLRVDGEVVEGPEAIDPEPSFFSIDTGYSENEGATIANGEPDDHWIVTGPGVPPQFATIVPDDAFPIPPWIATTAQSKWIGLDAPSSNGAEGTFVFRIDVLLPEGFDAESARLIGSWTADNGASDVLVNGVSTGVGVPGSFDVLSAIPADTGLGLFTTGENTIEILVDNAAPDGNPTGLRVEGVVGTGTVDPRSIVTGVGGRGIGALPAGFAVSDWRVVGPDGGGPKLTEVLAPEAGWVAAPEGTRWIGLAGDETPGVYTFEKRFVVPPEINIHRAVLTGSFAATTAQGDILLNGESLAIAPTGPGTLDTLPLGAGRGAFVPGENVLTVVLDTEEAGPVGIIFDATIDVVAEAGRLDISTGFDQEIGAVLGDSEPDDDWEVTDTLGITEAAVVLAQGEAPIPPWIPNTATSRWIGPVGAAAAAPGDYRYQIFVDLEADEVESAHIVGFWSTDNLGTELLVNEVSTGITNDGNFTSSAYFPEDAGAGLFLEGSNLIEIVVNNAGDAANPTGLRVDAFVAVSGGPPAPERFIRGDADGSGGLNITDGIFILNYLFTGGPDPQCSDSADADDSGLINITDGIYVLSFLFTGGTEPPAPYPDCGTDPTDDDGIPCETTVTPCL